MPYKIFLSVKRSFLNRCLEIKSKLKYRRKNVTINKIKIFIISALLVISAKDKCAFPRKYAVRDNICPPIADTYQTFYP